MVAIEEPRVPPRDQRQPRFRGSCERRDRGERRADDEDIRVNEEAPIAKLIVNARGLARGVGAAGREVERWDATARLLRGPQHVEATPIDRGPPVPS